MAGIYQTLGYIIESVGGITGLVCAYSVYKKKLHVPENSHIIEHFTPTFECDEDVQCFRYRYV